MTKYREAKKVKLGMSPASPITIKFMTFFVLPLVQNLQDVP